jgi:hypothetical protein
LNAVLPVGQGSRIPPAPQRLAEIQSLNYPINYFASAPINTPVAQIAVWRAMAKLPFF